MAHTPGPWKSITFRSSSQSMCVAIESKSVTTGYNRDRIEPGVVAIMQVFPGRFLDQVEEDAKLIAAAPGLLRLLRQLYDLTDGCVGRYEEEYQAAMGESHKLLTHLGG